MRVVILMREYYDRKTDSNIVVIRSLEDKCLFEYISTQGVNISVRDLIIIIAAT